jgi:hypothetical protein
VGQPISLNKPSLPHLTSKWRDLSHTPDEDGDGSGDHDLVGHIIKNQCRNRFGRPATHSQ